MASAASLCRSARPAWNTGVSSASSPSQARPSKITCTAASVERSRSVSSIRSRNLPPVRRAYSQLNSAVRAVPMCMAPVGEGAIRVTTGRSDIDGQRPGEAAARRAWAAPLSTRPPGRPRAADVLACLNGQVARQAERWTLRSPMAFGLDVTLFGAGLWPRRRSRARLETEADRDSLYAYDRWNCAPRFGAPVRVRGRVEHQAPVEGRRF